MLIKIKQVFVEKFGEQPQIFRSPGRVNLLGEHTDYNEGFVLPAAIDRAAYISIALRADDEIHLFAQDLNESFTISINELQPNRESRDGFQMPALPQHFLQFGFRHPVES